MSIFGDVPAGEFFEVPRELIYFELSEKSPDRGHPGRRWVYIRIGRTNMALNFYTGFPKEFNAKREVLIISDAEVLR